MISHLFLAAPNSDKPKLCVIQRKIEHDCTYSLPVGWRACFLVHTTVMAYGSKQLRSSLVRQSVVDTPPILDTLQKNEFFAGERRYSHSYQKTKGLKYPSKIDLD